MPIINQSQRTKAQLNHSTEATFYPGTYNAYQSLPCLPPSLQDLVKQMMASLSQVRDERIQALREQVQDGRYQIDTTTLAEKLLHPSHPQIEGGIE